MRSALFIFSNPHGKSTVLNPLFPYVAVCEMVFRYSSFLHVATVFFVGVSLKVIEGKGKKKK